MTTALIHFMTDRTATTATTTVTTSLAALPEATAKHYATAQAGLNEGNLFTGSVHLMYATDSAARTLGYMHEVSIALRHFRSVVMAAIYNRTDRAAESLKVVNAARRCQAALSHAVSGVAAAAA